MAERFPIESYLVPAAGPAPPETMTRLAMPLARGVPQKIELDRDVSLVVVVPTGTAVTWRDADPSALVSTGAEQLDAVEADDAAVLEVVDRAAPRALVLLRDRPVASVPLVAGARRAAPDDGGDQGEVVEVTIVDWELRAGTVRGAGDFGSRLELAFRRSDAGAPTFAPPGVHPQLTRRLGADRRVESEVGRRA